jgi:hypothetical protein
MAQLIVCLILLIILSRWDKPSKKKRPNYNEYQMKEKLRNMFK